MGHTVSPLMVALKIEFTLGSVPSGFGTPARFWGPNLLIGFQSDHVGLVSTPGARRALGRLQVAQRVGVGACWWRERGFLHWEWV